MSMPAMAVSLPPTLAFTVRRAPPVLIPPAKETPRGLKLLSDIDDQVTMRFYLPMVIFYPYNAAMNGRDPAEVISGAIGKALVYYYPLAGRVTELGPRGKLAVDCTGEGVTFVEADADVRLEDFIGVPIPPVPAIDELAVDLTTATVGSSSLLLFQVTRLACGGFILAVRFFHPMCDGPGLSQFLAAVGEFARGADRPSVPPVWSRDLLIAGSTPSITHFHPEYHAISMKKPPSPPPDYIVHRSFFLTSRDISVLRSRLPADLLRRSSTFEVLAAAVWRSRTVALGFSPEEKVRLFNVVNVDNRKNPWLPEGFYGNAFAFTLMETTAGKLSGEPMSYALELIQKAKIPLTKEYMQSLANMLELRGRPAVSVEGTYNTYVVVDVTRTQFHLADYGWGKGVFGAPATCGTDWLPEWVMSYFVRFKNFASGEDRIALPVRLPAAAMRRFIREMERITKPESAL